MNDYNTVNGKICFSEAPSCTYAEVYTVHIVRAGTVPFDNGAAPFDNGAAPFVNGTEWHRACRTGTVPFGRTLRKAYVAIE